MVEYGDAKITVPKEDNSFNLKDEGNFECTFNDLPNATPEGFFGRVTARGNVKIDRGVAKREITIKKLGAIRQA